MSAPKDRPLTSERERFLNLRNLPAQLSATETSHLLGCAPHDVPVLVAKGLLKPLGNPSANAVKYFARVTLLELCDDAKWIFRVRATINDYWRIKNAGRASVEYEASEQTQDTEQRFA
jgi:hypothetical protein